jgi:MFS family permease
VHFNCLSLGALGAWCSVSMLLFKSEETPLNRSMTETEISLLASLLFPGAFVGMALTGTLLDWLGRKNCSILIAVTETVRIYIQVI